MLLKPFSISLRLSKFEWAKMWRKRQLSSPLILKWSVQNLIRKLISTYTLFMYQHIYISICISTHTQYIIQKGRFLVSDWTFPTNCLAQFKYFYKFSDPFYKPLRNYHVIIHSLLSTNMSQESNFGQCIAGIVGCLL